MKFSKRSKANLETCAPPLQLLFFEIIRHVDCTIICGHRGKEAQEEAYRTGTSRAKWGQSPHNSTPSRAVDVMPYPINWDDIRGIHRFAGYVLGTADQMKIGVRWGGDKWMGFFDGPHYELT